LESWSLGVGGCSVILAVLTVCALSFGYAMGVLVALCGSMGDWRTTSSDHTSYGASAALVGLCVQGSSLGWILGEMQCLSSLGVIEGMESSTYCVDGPTIVLCTGALVGLISWARSDEGSGVAATTVRALESLPSSSVCGLGSYAGSTGEGLGGSVPGLNAGWLGRLSSSGGALLELGVAARWMAVSAGSRLWIDAVANWCAYTISVGTVQLAVRIEQGSLQNLGLAAWWRHSHRTIGALHTAGSSSAMIALAVLVAVGLT